MRSKCQGFGGSHGAALCVHLCRGSPGMCGVMQELYQVRGTKVAMETRHVYCNPQKFFRISVRPQVNMHSLDG